MQSTPRLQRLSSRNWAFSTAAAVLFAGLVLPPFGSIGLREGLERAVGGSAFPKAWHEESLRLEGGIATDSYERLTAAWNAAPGRYKRVTLDSHGGELFPAISLAAFIRQHGLDTYVGDRGECRSACTLVFQAGVRRIAHPTATFAYHCVIVQVPESDRCYTSTAFTRLYKDAMKHYGAPASLLDRIVPDETIRLTSHEALDYGIVTELDSRR